MEQKETIAQLLKEFEVKKVYSPTFGEVEFVCEQPVKFGEKPAIRVRQIDNKGTVTFTLMFLYDGRYDKNGECMLFLDKDHTPITRENLERLYSKWTIKDAKKGDVLYAKDNVFLFNGIDYWKFDEQGDVAVATAYCCADNHGDFCTGGPDCIELKNIRPATQEEKDLLFQKMEEACYEWDTKRLELRKKKKPIKTRENLERLHPKKIDLSWVNALDKIAISNGYVCVGTDFGNNPGSDGTIICKYKKLPKENFIKTWEDIKEQKTDAKIHIALFPDTHQGYFYENEKLAKHALAEAKISQILAQGDYKVADYKSRGWEIFWHLGSNCFDIRSRDYNATGNILYFETDTEANKFLSYTSNKSLAEYFMIE